MAGSSDHDEGPDRPPTDGGRQVIRPVGIASTSGVNAPRLRTRTNFAVPYLIAAARFSRTVRDLEHAYREDAIGKPWQEVYGASAACVTFSFFALEAYINEVFVDRERHFPETTEAERERAWKEVMVGRRGFRVKIDEAVRLAGADTINWGGDLWQSITALGMLRDGLVHGIPEWHDEQDWHGRISKVLQRRATASTQIQLREGEGLFPRSFASHETTRWAVKSVIQAVDNFSEATGIENKLTPFRTNGMLDLDPPTQQQPPAPGGAGPAQ